MTANRDKVLAIPELLESILVQLSFRTLLLAQRVSKDWQDVITTSVTIQEALFFAPKPLKSLLANEEPGLNPFFNSIIQHVGYKQGVERPQRLEECKSSTDGFGDPYQLPECDHAFHIHLDVYSLELRERVKKGSLGSWRRMLITNPPSAVHFLYGWARTHMSECSATTIGELVALLEESSNRTDSNRRVYDFNRMREVELEIQMEVQDGRRAKNWYEYRDEDHGVDEWKEWVWSEDDPDNDRGREVNAKLKSLTARGE